MQTRTIRYRTEGGVELIDVPVNDPNPHEVQVQALACGICAWDIHVYRNGSQWDVMPGHEGVGRVIKVGKDVQHLEVGMRVTGHGLGFTEISNVHAWNLHRLPDNGLADEHLIVEPVSCVVTGLDHCHLKAGDRVAVLGCGFMGLMMLQALGRSFAERVIAVDLDPAKLELAKRFGATECYDSSKPELEEQINELKAMQIDTVIDCTGAQKGLEIASKIVKRGGRLNLFGWNHGTANFPGDIWHMEGITVINSAPASQLRDPFPPAIRLLERGIIDLGPLVTHVVSLDQYPELLAMAAQREGSYIKGVVRLSSN